MLFSSYQFTLLFHAVKCEIIIDIYGASDDCVELPDYARFISWCF